MKTITLAISIAALSLVGTANSQDATMPGMAMELPKACQAAKAPAMPGMENMDAMVGNMTEAQKMAMDSMMKTHGPMMQGMMAEDPDVAFACGMIPHHMAAIGMAEVELKYGDAGPMKEMAQKIIDAQKAEIAELTTWIDGQAQ